MTEFFENVMIITGGLVCLIFWAVVVVGGLIELYDNLRGDKNRPLSIVEGYDDV